MFEASASEDGAFQTPAPAAAASMPDAGAGRAQRVLSPAMSALVAAVDAVLAQVPSQLPGAQALADTAALLTQVERLRAGALGRIADVDHRTLHVLDGAPSASSWVDAQQTSLDRGEVALARRMGSLPRLDEAVRDGVLPIAAPSGSARC